AGAAGAPPAPAAPAPLRCPEPDPATPARRGPPPRGAAVAARRRGAPVPAPPSGPPAPGPPALLHRAGRSTARRPAPRAYLRPAIPPPAHGARRPRAPRCLPATRPASDAAARPDRAGHPRP